MKATTKVRRDEKVLSGYLRCCRVDLIGICGLRGHKTGRQARDEGGRLNTYPMAWVIGNLHQTAAVEEEPCPSAVGNKSPGTVELVEEEAFDRF